MGIFVTSCSNIRIEDCHMLRAAGHGYAAIQVQWSNNVMIIGCTIDEGVNGIKYYVSQGEVVHCRISGCSNYGVISNWDGADLMIQGCTILNTVAAIRADANAILRGTGNVFQGSIVTLSLRHASVTLRDCHILNGGGLSVELTDDIRYGIGSYDLVGNWWGTTDADQIDAWILDANDNAQIGAVVQYVPFLDHPVGTERKTLGGIKGMFR